MLKRGEVFVVISLFVSLVIFMGSVGVSEGAWPCDDFNCTAGDVTADKVWLGDINGNELPNCNPGDTKLRISGLELRIVQALNVTPCG